MSQAILSTSDPTKHGDIVLNPDGSDILKGATVDSNGLHVNPRTGFTLPPYDYCSQVQAATTDTWTFKTGGSGGTTVATITITYTSSDKQTISSVAKT